MAEIVEFAAMRYNQTKVEDLSRLICPPYDMIDNNLRTKLMDQEKYNYVNLILPEGDETEKYRNAMRLVFSWLLRDVLVVDTDPSYYIYQQTFNFEGETFTRQGIIGLIRLEDYGNNVKRHELTFPKYVEDRYNLLKETEIEFESIFFLFKDEQKTINSDVNAYIGENKPVFDVQEEEGNQHAVYKVTSPELNTKLKAFFSDKKVYIADGHHRYETALRYMKAQKEAKGDKYTGKEPFNFLMGVFFNGTDDAIKILPTHRLIQTPSVTGVELLKQLEPNFNIASMQFDDARMEKAARIKLRKLLTDYKASGKTAYGIYFKAIPNKYFIISLKDELKKTSGLESLDVSTLQTMILKSALNISTDGQQQIFYVRGDSKALDLVKNDNYGLAFILNPVDPVTMMQISDNNEEMPHKSTDFYPKILSGLTAYSFKYSKIKV